MEFIPQQREDTPSWDCHCMMTSNVTDQSLLSAVRQHVTLQRPSSFLLQQQQQHQSHISHSICAQCYRPLNRHSLSSFNGLCQNCTAKPGPTRLLANSSNKSSSSLSSSGSSSSSVTSPEFANDTLAMSSMLNVVDDILREDEPLQPFCSVCNSVNVMTLSLCLECQIHFCFTCFSRYHSRDHHSIMLTSLVYTSYNPTLPYPTPSIPAINVTQSLDEDKLKSEICEEHKQELLYFCNTCLEVLCFVCLSSELHQNHTYVGLKEAFDSTFSALHGKLGGKLELLHLSAESTEKLRDKVLKNKETTVLSLHQSFQTLRESLVAREKEVLAQINMITDLRLESLTREIKDIDATINIVKNLALKEQKQEKLPMASLVIAHHRLKNLRYIDQDTVFKSIEDDSYLVQSNITPTQTALKSFCSLSTAPYPPLCIAVGEGLHHPRINRLSTVIIHTKDRLGMPCREGGEQLFIKVICINEAGSDSSVAVDIRDNLDGTYTASYRPHCKGEHQLVIAIRGHHIQGSPYSLTVDGGRDYANIGVVIAHMFGSEGTNIGQLSRPWGICSDQKGNIIVGDRSNHRVQVFDSNGVFLHTFGSHGVRPGEFNRPAGVAVTREGYIVVADKDNHRVQVLTLEGNFVFMFGSKGSNDGQMIYPYDVSVNQADGRICVTDTGNHRILIFNHEGKLIGKFGYKGYLCGHFDSPRGISFADDGHIIVSDFNVHHILVIHPNGTTAHILGSQGTGNGQFMRPQGIAIDHMGNFIIADTRNSRIVIMQPNGRFITKFGNAGNAKGQFDRPTDVTVLPDGKIAVLDFGNSRIQIF